MGGSVKLPLTLRGFAFGRELELQMFIKQQKMIEEIKVEDNNVSPPDAKPVLVAVLITEHAYERAKERLNWKSKVLDKMAEKAFLEGIKHKDTKGSLIRYLTKLWFNYKHCNNVRIYGENIFFFCDNRLITLYQLPNHLRKHVKYCH